MATLADNTELQNRVSIEEVLKKSEARFRQVVELAPNAMVMINDGA